MQRIKSEDYSNVVYQLSYADHPLYNLGTEDVNAASHLNDGRRPNPRHNIDLYLTVEIGFDQWLLGDTIEVPILNSDAPFTGGSSSS